MTNLLLDDLKSVSHKGRPVPPKIQILVTLRYLGSASLQSTVGDAHNLSQPTVSLCVNRVCNALIEKKNTFICWPTSLRTIQTKFFEIASFPKVVGVIDGTHNSLMTIPMRLSIASISLQSTFVQFVIPLTNSHLFLSDGREAATTVLSLNKQIYGMSLKTGEEKDLSSETVATHVGDGL